MNKKPKEGLEGKESVSSMKEPASLVKNIKDKITTNVLNEVSLRDSLIQKMVSFDRVKILSEEDDFYIVDYAGHNYNINKSNESYFLSSGGGNMSMGMTMQLKLEQRLTLNEGTFLDEDTPEEFKEVIIFHEIQEEYYVKKLGHNDSIHPHNRAMHDEALYVLRYLPPEMQEKYFVFANNMRSVYSELGNLDDEEIIDLLNSKELSSEKIDFIYKNYELNHEFKSLYLINPNTSDIIFQEICQSMIDDHDEDLFISSIQNNDIPFERRRLFFLKKYLANFENPVYIYYESLVKAMEKFLLESEFYPCDEWIKYLLSYPEFSDNNLELLFDKKPFETREGILKYRKNIPILLQIKIFNLKDGSEKNNQTKRFMALSQNLDIEIYKLLSNSNDYEILSILAENRSEILRSSGILEDIVKKYISSKDSLFLNCARLAIINPLISIKFISEIFKSKNVPDIICLSVAKSELELSGTGILEKIAGMYKKQNYLLGAVTAVKNNQISTKFLSELAKNTDLPLEIQDAILGSKDIFALNVLASNPGVKDEILLKLTKFGHSTVKNAVIENKNSSLKTRIIAGGTPFSKIEDIDEIRELAQDPAVILQLIDNTNTPIDILVDCAQNPPKFAMEKLAKIKNIDVQLSVLKSQHSTPEIINSLDWNNLSFVLRVSSDPQVPENILIELSKSNNEEVKINIASNQSTPIKVLEVLAREYSNKVKEAVANNHKSSLELKISTFPGVFATTNDLSLIDEFLSYIEINKNEWLGITKGVELYKYIYPNKNIPIDKLLTFENKKNNIKAYALSNPKMPEEFLIEYAQAPDADIRAAIVKNPSTPVEALELLAKDKLFWIRTAVSNHPNASELMKSRKPEILATTDDITILEHYMNDKEVVIIQAIASNPNFSKLKILKDK